MTDTKHTPGLFDRYPAPSSDPNAVIVEPTEVDGEGHAVTVKTGREMVASHRYAAIAPDRIRKVRK